MGDGIIFSMNEMKAGYEYESFFFGRRAIHCQIKYKLIGFWDDISFNHEHIIL